jgi:hypothetical protein
MGLGNLVAEWREPSGMAIFDQPYFNTGRLAPFR